MLQTATLLCIHRAVEPTCLLQIRTTTCSSSSSRGGHVYEGMPFEFWRAFLPLGGAIYREVTRSGEQLISSLAMRAICRWNVAFCKHSS
jgi:hypothetical protein